MPLPISVVVPAYDAERFLSATLASVRAQTAQPAELIVVDDGSSDATVAVARSFDARVISIPNGGVGAARNVGIRAARHAWLAFLDADDVWRPERLARSWEATRGAIGPLIVGSNYTFAGETAARGGALRAMAQYRALARKRVAPGVVTSARDDLVRALARGNFIAPSGLLVDRRIFDEHQTMFAERAELAAGDAFYVAEDYEWTLRALAHAELRMVEVPLFAYRRSPHGLSGDGGRVKLGDVVLGEAIGSNPQRYVPGAAAAFAAAREGQLIEAGLRYVRVGDIARAHAAFARGLGPGERTARALAFAAAPFGATAAGRRAFTVLFAVWSRVVRPLVGRARAPTRRGVR